MPVLRPSIDAWAAARVRLLLFLGVPPPPKARSLVEAIGPNAHPWWNVSLKGIR